MTDHIDLDEIEQQLRTAAQIPRWLTDGKDRFRCDAVLALVRAVRAAITFETLRDAPNHVLQRATFDLEEALAPFRKEEA